MFMKHFESMAIEQAADKPSFWVHYMDDTFVIWPHDERKLEKFLELLSTQRDPIEFTTELESDGVIPFLDINVRREKGRLRTVYTERRHTRTGTSTSTPTTTPRLRQVSSPAYATVQRRYMMRHP